MSDSQDYGAAYLTATETIEGSWGPNGDDYPLKVEDISIGSFELLQQYAEVAALAAGEDGDPDEERLAEANERAEDLDPLPWEDEVDEDGFLEATIQAKLKRPDVDISEARAHKLRYLFEGMMEAWQEGNQ